ncbi:hypothetical protein [Chlamydia buteonis]|uniref:Inner membrane protein n=1 Tax=Chlamydia buteonis TaxID=2494525 RepID=A0ABX8LAG4_9CHLA|nr:hypothetical protein [Chlamydia buteonis]QXE27061.1 hypothetical protein HBN95_02815 [Chlamydia buteonis]QXE28004.1 hypothetical protein JJJ19_00330 [Chlamydia buteonis]
MTCYLTFGKRDLNDFSSTTKAVCVVFDLITFPVISVVISVLSWAFLLIKIVAKTLKFLVLAMCSLNLETSFSKVFRKLKTEIISEHLVLIPLIGGIIHGLILTYQVDQNGYAAIGSLDSFVSFMASSPLYLEHVARW